MSTEAFSIEIPENAWSRCLDDRSYLRVTLIINGTSHHLNAIEVTEIDCDEQVPMNPRLDEEHEAMRRIAGSDAQFETIKVGRRKYIVVATPFQ